MFCNFGRSSLIYLTLRNLVTLAKRLALPQFGQVTSQINNPRLIQFALRLSF